MTPELAVLVVLLGGGLLAGAILVVLATRHRARKAEDLLGYALAILCNVDSDVSWTTRPQSRQTDEWKRAFRDWETKVLERCAR